MDEFLNSLGESRDVAVLLDIFDGFGYTHVSPELQLVDILDELVPFVFIDVGLAIVSQVIPGLLDCVLALVIAPSFPEDCATL